MLFQYDPAVHPTTCDLHLTTQLFGHHLELKNHRRLCHAVYCIFQQVYEGHLDQTEISIFLLTVVEWIGLLCDFARHPTPITTYIQVPTYMDRNRKFTIASQFLLLFDSGLDLEYSNIITRHVASGDEIVSFQGGIYSAQ